MAGVKISALPVGSAATLTDILPVVQGGVTSQETLAQVRTLLIGSGNWTVVTGTSATMVSGGGYISNNGSLVSLTLPATSSVGDSLFIAGLGAGGWSILQGASQIIHIGSVASTAGAGGSVSSTNRYDSVELVCAIANTTWLSLGGPQGNITIV
jgi:hypothetical protein